VRIPADSRADIDLRATRDLRHATCPLSWQEPGLDRRSGEVKEGRVMPLILWLLGVPLTLIVVLWLMGVV
jgi:hypothetical protein